MGMNRIPLDGLRLWNRTKDKSKDCFVAGLLAMTGEIKKDPLLRGARDEFMNLKVKKV